VNHRLHSENKVWLTFMFTVDISGLYGII